MTRCTYCHDVGKLHHDGLEWPCPHCRGLSAVSASGSPRWLAAIFALVLLAWGVALLVYFN